MKKPAKSHLVSRIPYGSRVSKAVKIA